MTEQQETVSVVQSEALLPCPFCGASAEWRDDPGVCDVLYGLVVIHTSGCFLNSVCFAKTDAITAWNQRTRNSDVSGDVVERHFEIVVGKKQARATVGERELIRLINGGAKIWQIASLPQQRPAVELKGPFPEKSPFGEVGCYGSPDAYLIDPGAGSASDQVSRFWPSRRQLNDIHERDGSITPLYGSRNSLTPDQQAAMAGGEEWECPYCKCKGYGEVPDLGGSEVRCINCKSLVPAEPSRPLSGEVERLDRETLADVIRPEIVNKDSAYRIADKIMALLAPVEEWEGDLTTEEQAMIDSAWEKHKAAGPCDRPPEGWSCTRHYGHGGPCGALRAQPQPAAGELEEQARELLAAEWDAVGRSYLAKSIRAGREDEWSKAGPAVRAILAALRRSPSRGDIIEECASIADMHDHRGDIGKAIRALKAPSALKPEGGRS